MLPAGLITMLQQLPNNPMIRTQVHSVLKWPIPEDKTTYEQIRDWIELGDYSCLKGAITPTSEPYMPEEPATSELARMARAMGEGDDDPAVTANVRYTYTEVGRCHYSEDYAGNSDYSLSVEELNGILDDASEHGWSLDQIMDRVREDLRDKCYENTPDCEPVDDTLNHDDHSSDDTTNSNATVANITSLRSSVRNWIREYRPEVWEEMSDTAE